MHWNADIDRDIGKQVVVSISTLVMNGWLVIEKVEKNCTMNTSLSINHNNKNNEFVSERVSLTLVSMGKVSIASERRLCYPTSIENIHSNTF